MIGHLEPIDRIINRVIRDLGLGEEEIPYQDYIEWAADALEHIGAYDQLTQKECLIGINEHRGTLPCDYMELIDIVEGCEIKPGAGGFTGNSLMGFLSTIGYDFDSLDAYSKYVLLPHTMSSPQEAQKEKLVLNRQLMGDVSLNAYGGKDYNINHNLITTAFQYGILRMKYLAMPVDDRNFPLVPDNVSYRDALFWKIAMQISMRNPDLLKNQQLRNFEYCRLQWQQYCGQARADANMPDIKALERLKNNWLRLVPVMEIEERDYYGMGQAQKLNLHGIR